MTSDAHPAVDPARVRFVTSAPEQMFGLAQMECSDEGVVSAIMPTGPWLRGPAGREGTLGALGVLTDLTLGHANHVFAPPGLEWSVTTTLTLELVAPVPTDGQALRAVAKAIGTDGTSALSTGEVRTEAGVLVAIASERGRFVPYAPPSEAFAAGHVQHHAQLPERTTTASLLDLVGTIDGPDDAMYVPVGSQMVNPLGNLHGGISLALSDLAAAVAVPSALTTTAIQMSYVRPLTSGAGDLGVSVVRVHEGRSLASIDVLGRRLVDGKLVFRGVVTRG